MVKVSVTIFITKTSMLQLDIVQMLSFSNYQNQLMTIRTLLFKAVMVVTFFNSNLILN